MVLVQANVWWMPLPFQYNTLLSNMETKYSVAEVCRDNGACHPLDPGETMEYILRAWPQKYRKGQEWRNTV